MMRCVLLCVFVAASGCVNLQSVSRFAKVSAATADSDAAVADYVGSLERQRRMLPEDQRAELDAQLVTRREQQTRLLVCVSVDQRPPRLIVSASVGRRIAPTSTPALTSARLNEVAKLAGA